MSVTIRLRRMGRNNLPVYRVVAADTRRSNQGRYIELLGWYDPSRNGEFSLKMDRVEYWVSQGAVLTDTVKNLISKQRKKPTATAPAEPVQAAPAEDTAPAEEAAPAGESAPSSAPETPGKND